MLNQQNPQMQESTTSPSSTTGSTPPLARERHRLPLSCRECQRKKIKCDRSYPCGQCLRAGHSCTPSTRKPRAKVGSRAVDIELRNRIAKLEKLVETFQGDEEKSAAPVIPETASSTATDHPDPVTVTPPRKNTVAFTGLCVPEADESSTSTAGTNRSVAGSFLTTLTTEVQALREAFEEHDEDDEDDTLSSEPTPPQLSNTTNPTNPTNGAYELLLAPPGSLFVMPGVLRDPEPAMFTELCNMYVDHLEAMSKIFHGPTLAAFLFKGEPYLGNDPEAPCNKALRAAICFAGVVVMTESETQAKFGKHRDQLVFEYRRMADVAIYQTDPLNTTDLATLQALVVFLASIRLVDPSRRAWTMLGLVVRIARALNVHREVPTESVFMRELRRRLWFNIIYIDCYSAMDRGSETCIDPASYDRRLPTNCNDTDFDETTSWLSPREGEITDMSFALVCVEGAHMVLHIDWSDRVRSESTQQTIWQRRLELANAFSRSVEAHSLRYCDPTITLQRLLIRVGKAAAHAMVLRAVRPLQPHIVATTAASPPRVSTLWVLQLAVIFLHHCKDMMDDAEATYCWRGMPWVPWHAIAVTLAGLCSVRDTALADEAWALVESAMPQHERLVADSRTGMLWKPIEKLHRKAAAFRDEGLRSRLDGEASQLSQPSSLPHPQTQTQQSLHPELAEMWMSASPSQPPQATGLDSLIASIDSDMAATIPPAPIATDMSESSLLQFPPDMLSTVPDEGSWLDWETIMKDMDEVNTYTEDMQIV